MTSDKRGLCVIINNEYFTPTSRLNWRRRSDLDVLKLQQVFSTLGFDVQLRVNQTADMAVQTVAKGL